MSKVDEIIEQLKSLTLLEAADLVKQIEETFDVSAAASAGAVGMVMAPAAGGGAEAPRGSPHGFGPNRQQRRRRRGIPGRGAVALWG